MRLSRRRKSTVCLVGGVPIGGEHPVVIQSMTDTPTADVEKTAAQAISLARAGSELVRLTVNDSAAARAVPEIVKRMEASGCPVPLVGDFHFNGHLLLMKHPALVQALSKLRINPGNMGLGVRHDANFRTFVEIAIEAGKPVRIGVNAGSLDRELFAERMDKNGNRTVPLSAEDVQTEALVESATQSAEVAIGWGLPEESIILSCKVSRLPQMVDVYRRLGKATGFPLHLGLTEAGMGIRGIVTTASALAILLDEGIGDTVRASLTPEPHGDRTAEVRLCQEILQGLTLRSFRPSVTACPGCGRTSSDLFRRSAAEIQERLDKLREVWTQAYPGSETLAVAVMGCVVNGPGESKAADIGMSLPGAGESPKVPLYVDGEQEGFLEGEGLVDDFMERVKTYVAKRWGDGVS